MRDEFIITRHGKHYALYGSLLDEAHARGLSYLDTDLIQAPDDDNGHVAIVKAVAGLPRIDRQTGEIVVDPETKEPLTKRFSGLERVMNFGENRIEMRIPRSAWSPHNLRFPHS